MLGSIVRLFVFIACVAGGVWAVTALMQTDGSVTLRLGETEHTLSPVVAAIAACVAFVAVSIALKVLGLLIEVLRFVSGDDSAFGRLLERGRERRGLDALAGAMTAIAAGDAAEGRTMAERAERLLDRPDLTRPLNAKAADLAGDRRRARRYYRALAADPDTALIGIKGLLGHALADGAADRARRLAERGLAIAPEDSMLLDTLYRLQSEAYEWHGARQTLARQRRCGLVTEIEGRRCDATLALALSEDADTAGDAREARQLAVEAARLDPANSDAVAAAARHLRAAGQVRPAARLIVEGWQTAPSPQLAEAFADLVPDETPTERRARFSRLFEANPDHRETHFLKAELALVAEDWAGARAAVNALREDAYSARSCTLLAAAARGEGADEAVVRGWLARAAGASRDGASDSQIRQAAMLPLLVNDRSEGAVQMTRRTVGELSEVRRA